MAAEKQNLLDFFADIENTMAQPTSTSSTAGGNGNAVKGSQNVVLGSSNAVDGNNKIVLGSKNIALTNWKWFCLSMSY